MVSHALTGNQVRYNTIRMQPGVGVALAYMVQCFCVVLALAHAFTGAKRSWMPGTRPCVLRPVISLLCGAAGQYQFWCRKLDRVCNLGNRMLSGGAVCPWSPV